MSDYKTDTKSKHVNAWANSELSVPAYIAKTDEITMSNPGTFSEWIKTSVKESATREGELRKANNDLQTIVDRDANELKDYAQTVERLNKEIAQLKSVKSGQPTTVILNLEERVKELEKENTALKNDLKKYSYHGLLSSAIEILESKGITEDHHMIKHFKEYDELQKENAALKSTSKTLNPQCFKVEITPPNRLLQEKIAILEKALTIADNAMQIILSR